MAKTIINYVFYFFSCRHCAENFNLKVQNMGFLPSKPSHSILWLWQIHNMANIKLKGEKTFTIYGRIAYSNHKTYSIGICLNLSVFKLALSLCSRNFQNVKLRLEFVEFWYLYCPSYFTWNRILANSNGLKMSFLCNFRGSDFWFFLVNFSIFQVPNLPKFKVQSL